jgi:hypothetical protein
LGWEEEVKRHRPPGSGPDWFVIGCVTMVLVLVAWFIVNK